MRVGCSVGFLVLSGSSQHHLMTRLPGHCERSAVFRRGSECSLGLLWATQFSSVVPIRMIVTCVCRKIEKHDGDIGNCSFESQFKEYFGKGKASGIRS